MPAVVSLRFCATPTIFFTASARCSGLIAAVSSKYLPGIEFACVERAPPPASAIGNRSGSGCCTFANFSEAFEVHGKLLSSGSPYRTAMEVAGDPDRFADALTGVYATDPQYGSTLKWVMDTYKLKQYD